MRKTAISIGVIFIFFVGFVIYSYRPYEDFNCRRNRIYKKYYFEGKIESITKNSKNHNNEIIQIGDYFYEYEEDWFESKSLIDLIEVGDSLVKQEGSLIIEIYRSGDKKTFDFELPCD